MSDKRRFALVPIAMLALAGALLVVAVAAPADAAHRADVTLTVTIPASNTGKGTVTATGIDCPGDCTETYPQGTAVTLTPNPAAGSTFDGWGGGCEGAETGPQRVCHYNGSASTTVSAIFSSADPPPGTPPADPPGTDPAPCEKAEEKLARAKEKLKRLRDEDAPKGAIKRAKQKVAKAKQAVRQACE